jgi:hypothetical protein
MQSTRIKTRSAALMASMSIASFGAFAWDGVIGGKIIRIDGVGGGGGAPGNFDARIYLENVSAACGSNTASWAYINSNDANYKGLLAMLLMAQASGKSVTLHTNKDTQGYCQIGFLTIAT